MKTISIYDPAMCCSTGVCGPSIDPELMRISSAIHTLKSNGITINRFGLSSEPQAFINNTLVNELLKQEGPDILPVTLLDGKVVKTKGYPSNEELSMWLEIEFENKTSQNALGCCGPKGCC